MSISGPATSMPHFRSNCIFIFASVPLLSWTCSLLSFGNAQFTIVIIGSLSFEIVLFTSVIIHFGLFLK